ncbi:alpha/beta hydrolase [Mesorhizobium sp. LHD-90]|uniref:alpha/beta hydrolase n=1 Tax=Mesorhizobium sp. LHD-90 TaxID=3071414 RepID=UPI0027DF41C3|nr:alpha/beta hydrolase [Mesorhizobium sp. LHD-90]MDQ6437335.1 alpha/beta hydrolase [Mesorhizobium sp. LHD-90]
MTDYSKLIDAETWAFIERTNSFYPPETIDFGIERQRAIYDLMCREFHAGYPDGVTAETGSIDLPDRAIPIRIYRTAAPEAAAMVLYLHGGGYILGGLDSHDDACAELCARTGYELVSVDYRLAPEHPHPAAFEDALAAFEWAAAICKRPIVLAGDSAGGNLAAAVSHATRGHSRMPIGQVLIYPTLGGSGSGRSYVEHAEAPMLTARDLEFYRDIRTGGTPPADIVTLYPLADTDFSGLPPTAIVTAQCDPLSSDGEIYRDRILAAGGKVWWREEPGLVHSFVRGRHMIARARDSFSGIVEAVSALGRREWPY